MNQVNESPTSKRAEAPSVAVRYRLAPLFGLIALGLVPVVALTALLVWSDQVADEHESRESVQAEPFRPPAEPNPALVTSMLDYRRTPSELASVGADNELSDVLDQLAAFIDARSCLAVSVDGRTITSWNGDVAVIPASTNKLLIAGAAVEVLGADYRFVTSVASPPPVEGIIDGDLYLVGGGDPVLVAADFPLDDDTPAAATTLETLADAVVAAGVNSVNGAVVGDASRYDDEFVNPAWDGAVAYVDAGPIGGLVVNDGRVVGRSGRQQDPGEAAAREFARLLRDRGVSVAGGSQAGLVGPGVPVIATAESPPLEAIVADMLTRSDNDTAEMLLKELGHGVAQPGTTAAGLDVLTRTVASWGAPMDDVVLSDASGLSSANRLTCDTLVSVLNHIEATPAVDGLPVAGRSGTLIDEFLGSPVEGSLRAKTGTLSNPPADADPPEVKALAGYLGAPNGEVLQFALVLNGAGYVTADGYVPFWSALAERLATHPDGPDPALLGPR
jgi:D-alanyl-D-alanine carboxypeptidase/D-alanyl-D-alanine-endopeptidase (penicillin-binding protein 4)